MKKAFCLITIITIICTSCTNHIQNNKVQTTNHVPIVAETPKKTNVEPVEATKSENVNPIHEYKSYIDNLDVKDINSVSKALEKVKTYLGENIEINDELYREFSTLYMIITSEIEDSASLMNDPESLKVNGFRVNVSESGGFIGSKPGFLSENFNAYVSDGIKEYLKISDEELRQLGEETGTYLIEDAGVSISWDQLADRIIAWENYINKYPNYPEVSEAEANIEFYLYVYTASVLDNTMIFSFDDKKLTQEVKESYERFIQKYSGSKYYNFISGYYDILKNNDYTLNEDAINYLKNNDIEVGAINRLLKGEY